MNIKAIPLYRQAFARKQVIDAGECYHILSASLPRNFCCPVDGGDDRGGGQLLKVKSSGAGREKAASDICRRVRCDMQKDKKRVKLFVEYAYSQIILLLLFAGGIGMTVYLHFLP